MTSLMRMARHTICLAAIGGFAMAAPAAAPDVPDSETYRCNTPNGHFDGTVFPFDSIGTTISGRIALHSADTGTEWASLGKVISHQHGAHFADGDCGCNGIVVYGEKDENRIVVAMLANGEETALGQSAFDEPIDFKISISPQGEMTVAIGKYNVQTRTVKLLHPEHNTMELTCSGADVSFYNMAAL